MGNARNKQILIHCECFRISFVERIEKAGGLIVTSANLDENET
jgi:hypothetical protein